MTVCLFKRAFNIRRRMSEWEIAQARTKARQMYRDPGYTVRQIAEATGLNMRYIFRLAAHEKWEPRDPKQAGRTKHLTNNISWR